MKNSIKILKSPNLHINIVKIIKEYHYSINFNGIDIANTKSSNPIDQVAKDLLELGLHQGAINTITNHFKFELASKKNWKLKEKAKLSIFAAHVTGEDIDEVTKTDSYKV